jgi:hypothetical protein
VTSADHLDELGSIEELRSLATDYGLTVDDRDGDRFAQLFVEDGELVVPKYPEDLRPVITRSGHEALRKIPDGLRRYDRTFHQISNHRYELDGSHATGTVLCVAHHVSFGPEAGVGGGTDLVWFIRYNDSYRRTDAGWKFVRRELHLQWVEEHAISASSAPTSS